MEARIDFAIEAQPDQVSCGPSCLQAVYGHLGDEIPLATLAAEVPRLEAGGTLAAYLGTHALARGYRARLCSWNLQLLDPTWRELGRETVEARLEAQARVKTSRWMGPATDAYLAFLRGGGELLFDELSGRLLRRFLDLGTPVIAGLSATYLYREPREVAPEGREDDVGGEPVGHFVVLCGYDRPTRRVLLADPLSAPGPVAVGIDRLVAAILLGALTLDAELLVIEPRR